VILLQYNALASFLIPLFLLGYAIGGTCKDDPLQGCDCLNDGWVRNNVSSSSSTTTTRLVSPCRHSL
jgi:hypothetical protein